LTIKLNINFEPKTDNILNIYQLVNCIYLQLTPKKINNIYKHDLKILWHSKKYEKYKTLIIKQPAVKQLVNAYYNYNNFINVINKFKILISYKNINNVYNYLFNLGFKLSYIDSILKLNCETDKLLLFYKKLIYLNIRHKLNYKYIKNI
jgi:hypothetical protein